MTMQTKTARVKTLILCDDPVKVGLVYGRGRREKIAAVSDLYPRVVSGAELSADPAAWSDVEAVFSTWGFPVAAAARPELLPSLRAVFYAAGSVRAFAPDLLARGVEIFGAWRANAIPVSEFACSLILLGLKGYFRNLREFDFHGPGACGETVAVLGAGAVGRRVLERLRAGVLDLAVCDPTLTDADAAGLGARKVELDEAFATAFVVSNHMPDLPATRRVVTAARLRSMRSGAVFVNTGRGATVDESALLRVLTERPDLTALLDVLETEPVSPDSPFRKLPNVFVSGHLAGAVNDEYAHLADAAIESFEAWRANCPVPGRITSEMLPGLA